MSTRLLAVPLAAALFLACGDDGKGDGEDDPSGDGDGDGEGDGDGDGDPSGDGDTGCTPGELDCACNNGLCLGDLECVNGLCVEECTPGALGCECNGGQCLAGLVCEGDVCVDPDCTPGELGCQCNNGLCLGDLVCSAGVCEEAAGDGDGDGDPCPLPNEEFCNGECVDVLSNNDHCGECGKTCLFNNDTGGCSEGSCLPFWSECFVPTVDFDNCNDACVAEGKMCTHGGCKGSTWRYHQIHSICQMSDNTGTSQILSPCDTQLAISDQFPYAQCCCSTN